MTVVVVSPHLDDAVLSAWLTLTAERALVVTCFAGAPATEAGGAWDAAAGLASPSVAVRTRRDEDTAALACAGARPLHLDLVDEQYRAAADPSPLAALADALRPHLASADEVWLPAGIGGHSDHLLAREAARLVVRPDQRARAYADLPYAGQPGWPGALTGHPRDRLLDLLLSRRPAQPAAAWARALTSLPVGPPQARRLSPGQRRAKAAALSCYTSQLPALRLGPGHPLRSRRLLAREVFWPLL